MFPTRALARLLSIVCLSLPVTAQGWISVGVKGGVPLTDPFADRTYQFPVFEIFNPFGPPFLVQERNHTFSSSKNFIIGPTIELRVPVAGLAVEADALYRPLNLTVQQTTATFTLPGAFLLGSPPLSTNVDSWEFPILAKYRFSVPHLKPYLEAGPSFRIVAGSLGKHTSHAGVSAGVGVEARLWRFSFAPEIRYTHWGSDSGYSNAGHPASTPNQVEFLLGLATTADTTNGKNTSRAAGSFLHYVSLGIKGGVPFTNPFELERIGIVAPLRCGNFSPYAACSPVFQYYDASRTYLIGPAVEVRLPLNLSIEADALYHPLNLLEPPSLKLVLPSFNTSDSWEFPIVGKYRFPIPFASPYLEAGPTFRALSSPLNRYLSSAGMVAGIGVDAKLWTLHLSPEVRFLHWGNDSGDIYPFSASKRNQAEFLVGLAY